MLEFVFACMIAVIVQHLFGNTLTMLFLLACSIAVIGSAYMQYRLTRLQNYAEYLRKITKHEKTEHEK